MCEEILLKRRFGLRNHVSLIFTLNQPEKYHCPAVGTFSASFTKNFLTSSSNSQTALCYCTWFVETTLQAVCSPERHNTWAARCACGARPFFGSCPDWADIVMHHPCLTSDGRGRDGGGGGGEETDGGTQPVMGTNAATALPTISASPASHSARPSHHPPTIPPSASRSPPKSPQKRVHVTRTPHALSSSSPVPTHHLTHLFIREAPLKHYPPPPLPPSPQIPLHL